jgi:uncharacterized protein
MENKTKIKIFVSTVFLALLLILANYIISEVISTSGNRIRRVYVRNILVKAELVNTQEKIERGLAGRENLDAGRGMLFEMPSNKAQNFWMKGMRFPIDIIWIENGRVIGCEKDISPDDPRIFSSPGEAGYVLEVPEGFCDENSVKINDAVDLGKTN